VDGETLIAFLIGVAPTAPGGLRGVRPLRPATGKSVGRGDRARLRGGPHAAVDTGGRRVPVHRRRGDVRERPGLSGLGGGLLRRRGAVVERYPEGETVTAHATNPSDSYLLAAGPPWKLLFVLGFGLLVLLFVVGEVFGVVEDVSS
jgi:hypothetical protein